jgi:hypothetical protein
MASSFSQFDNLDDLTESFCNSLDDTMNQLKLKMQVEMEARTKQLLSESAEMSIPKKKAPNKQVLKEDNISTPNSDPYSYITELADSFSKFSKRSDRSTSSETIKEDVVYDDKYHLLELQIQQLKNMISESTLVSGIGHGPMGMAYGSGEVRILNMDDYDNSIPIQPGDTLVWDGNKFIPVPLGTLPGPQGGGTPGGPGPQGPQGTSGAEYTVPISLTPPTSPEVGELWFNGTTTYIYYLDPSGSYQWVEVTP